MKKKRKGRRVVLLVGVAVLAVLVAIGLLYRREIRACYVLLTQFERLPHNEQGYAEYRHRQTGIVFVRVPGGKFQMGGTESEQAEVLKETGRNKVVERILAGEVPQHRVELGPFLIAKYEVSQSEWEKVMGENPSRFKGDDLPVEQVSWEDCKKFCEKTGLSLPTEPQWEYACRSGTTTPFAFGETITTDQVNYNGIPYGGAPKGEYREKTVPVDSFTPNAFGLYQMHGNAWEWCEDVYDGDFYSKPEATRKDPMSGSGSETRVLRGGSWDFDAGNCRSARRDWGLPSVRSGRIGFRPARSLP